MSQQLKVPEHSVPGSVYGCKDFEFLYFGIRIPWKGCFLSEIVFVMHMSEATLSFNVSSIKLY